MASVKKLEIVQLDKEVLERYGITNSFLRKAGITVLTKLPILKYLVRVHISQSWIEFFQILALYFRIRSTSINSYLLKHCQNLITELSKNNDPDWIRAKKMLAEINEIKFKEFEKNIKELKKN